MRLDNVFAASPDGFFARFHLIGPETLAEAMPVHTPGSGSDGMTVSSSPAILLQLPGETSFCYSFVCRFTSSCFHRRCVLVECAAREHGPHDPRILVGERDSRDIGMPPLPQLPKPEASGILLAG